MQQNFQVRWQIGDMFHPFLEALSIKFKSIILIFFYRQSPTKKKKKVNQKKLVTLIKG